MCPVFGSINESIFQETDAAASIKEIRRRDPYDHFSFDVCFLILSSPGFNNLLFYLFLICMD